MKYLTTGMVTLLVMAAAAFALGEQDKRAQIMLVGHVLGVLAMFCVAGMARQAEVHDRRRDEHRAPDRRVKLISGLAALLFPTLAHALAFFIFVALGIGAAVGLIGWGAIDFWSRMLSLEMVVGQRQEHAARSRPMLIAAVGEPRPLITATPLEIQVADTPWSYRNLVGKHALEWSDDLVTWQRWNGKPNGAKFWRVAR